MSGLGTGALWSRTCWGPCSGPNSRPGWWGLTAVIALLMEADPETLGRDLSLWLERVSTALPAESAFLTEMGRLLDPVSSALLQENCFLLPGESLASRFFVDHLWEMAPLIPTGPAL